MSSAKSYCKAQTHLESYQNTVIIDKAQNFSRRNKFEKILQIVQPLEHIFN